MKRKEGKMEVQGETAGCLQGIIGLHAMVLQSMCQQHAGIGRLARREMFKGIQEKRPRSKTWIFFFKAKLFL